MDLRGWIQINEPNIQHDANPRQIRSAQMNSTRPLNPGDCNEVLSVYREAVESGAAVLYSAAQCRAWAAQTISGPSRDALTAVLLNGIGLVSCSERGEIEAFAVLHPLDRLALLYCRSGRSRQGRASQLLEQLEGEAQRRGVTELRTEASFLSRPLLQRRGWHICWQEELLIEGQLFRRFRMAKPLPPILA
jgi:GNAT superfamily N-acetyltransferase